MLGVGVPHVTADMKLQGGDGPSLWAALLWLGSVQRRGPHRSVWGCGTQPLCPAPPGVAVSSGAGCCAGISDHLLEGSEGFN